jgi:4-hydroxy-2-oxoheptanedioate aldolase
LKGGILRDGHIAGPPTGRLALPSRSEPIDSTLRQGPLRGFWSVTAHHRILETAASRRPDFICLDAQHGTHLSALDPSHFDLLDRFGVPGLVRVAQASPVDIGRALDLGAAGVMVPMVETADQAKMAVAACRYSPDGIRSYGMQTGRVDPFDTSYRPLCAVQIETAGALEQIDAIAAVDGVDWLYIGPADLGLSIGSQTASDIVAVIEGRHPMADRMLEAFDRVITAAKAHHKLAGVHCGSGTAAKRAFDHGFEVASVVDDLTAVGDSLVEHLARSGRTPSKGEN